ncbi:Imm8 family immunity protein [Reinekea blandensis]|uniref:Uncharacterized protein n=1 Tax=Reinekea blandensis MED297 TaxID=314283 RepID=A4BFC2_9GAMM|nr:Imm8 family immunity protein [Reinekea blandensis]EAR09235.1 hypothetical protein MED297_07128 [Reinekea sp. MED297] [Reinekea blandensis MED297]
MKSLKTPVIKSWDCAEHDPIEAWVPEDPSDVEFWCNIAIGIEGEVGADNFQVHIATQKAVSRTTSKEFLVVIPYYENWPQVLGVLQNMAAQCKGLDWTSMSEQLSARFKWEYEGMG